jgi:hypothetical protein
MKPGIFKSAVFLFIILGFSLAFAGESLSQTTTVISPGGPFGYYNGKIVELKEVITKDYRGRDVLVETFTLNNVRVESKEFEYDYDGNIRAAYTVQYKKGELPRIVDNHYDYIEGKKTRIDSIITDKGEVTKKAIDLDKEGYPTRIVKTITNMKGEVIKTENDFDPKTKEKINEIYKKSDKNGNTLEEKSWSLRPDGGTRSREISTNPQGQIVSQVKEERDAKGKNISKVSERYKYDSRGRLVQYSESKTEGAKPAAVYIEARIYDGKSMTKYKAAAQQKGPNDLSLQPTTPRKVLGTSEVKTAAPGTKAPGGQAQPGPGVTPASVKPAQPAEGAARASQTSPAAGAKATADPKMGALPGKPASAAATPAAPKAAATSPQAATPTAAKPPALPGGAVSTPSAAVSPPAAPKVAVTPPKAAPPAPVKPPGLPGGAQAAPPRVTSPPPAAPQKATPPPSPPPKRPGDMR